MSIVRISENGKLVRTVRRLSVWNRDGTYPAGITRRADGAILVNVNPAYRTTELRYALDQSGCRMLVAAPAFKTSDYAAMIDEVSLLHAERHIQLERLGELRGQWDRERVEQVISNLLANALHHGRGTIRVRAAGAAAFIRGSRRCTAKQGRATARGATCGPRRR